MMTDKDQIRNTNKTAVTIKTLIEMVNLANIQKKREKEIVTEVVETNITQKGADQNRNHQLILIAREETKMAGEELMLKKKVAIKRAAEVKMMVVNMFLKTNMVAVKRHTETTVMMLIETK